MAEFHKVASTDEVVPGEVKQYRVEDRPVALCNVDGEFHAFEDVCTHAFAYLSEGGMEGDRIKCPLHGARFDVRDGRVLRGPATAPLRSYATRVVDDGIEVELPVPETVPPS